ncbi:9970_t:CDS:2, partial [Entrophospora sp. SA101]
MSVEETVNPTALLTESKPLILFPEGNKLRDANEYISLYLEAIQTPYENQNLIDTRYARFKLSIEMMEISDDFTKTNESKRSNSRSYFLSSTNEKFFEDDSFTDIRFLLDCGSIIKAHRVILAGGSAYFNKMLKGEWKESNSETIKIHSFKYETFRAILFYIYSGKLVDTQDLELLKDVYVKAEMMGLDGLLKLLVNKFSEIIDEDNWDDILILGQRTSNKPLKNI